jgi:cell wall-associated NlpC family hydrolase
MTLVAALATPAMASRTGGTSTGGSPAGAVAPTAPTAPTTRAAPTAPITARSSSLAYRGPVFQRIATGQLVPYVAAAPPGQVNGSTGGIAVGAPAGTKPELLVPGVTARVVNGVAAAPISVPPAVQQAIWTANQIIGLPYVFGGGHASFQAQGYDCSGTVSFALHGASLLSAPLDSSDFMRWGSRGVGQWVTIFTNPGHAYMTVAGLRLDTSAADDPSHQQGPRWRPLRRANGGFKVRHPLGL